MAALELTGERTLPGIAHERYWFSRHVAGYLAAARHLPRRGLTLDAGCGEGYGTALLAREGRRVVGLDLDAPTLSHARQRYSRNGFLRANLVSLPIADGSLDAVAALQVVEHLWSVDEWLDECLRVLRPGGVLVATTPNRLTFSPGLARDAKPTNPFHVRELDPDQLRHEVGRYLDVAELTGLDHGPRLRAWEAEHGDVVRPQLEPPSTWSAALTALVASVTEADVVATPDLARCRDLLVVARRPPR